MRKIFFVGFLFFCFSLSARAADICPSSTTVQTLADAYRCALLNSERISVSRELIRQAESEYSKTVGVTFPEISFQHATLWQDKSNSLSVLSPQNEGMFRLEKKELTGYRELAEIKAGRLSVAQKEELMGRVRQLLFRDVAGAYFGLLQAKENVGSTTKLIKFGEDRLKDLDERVRVGRNRPAEALEQRSQIVQLQAQAVENKRVLDANIDFLQFLVGVMVKDPNDVPDKKFDNAPSLDVYLSRAKNRPDIRAANNAVQIAEQSVRMARADYFPKLGIVGNYYTDRSHLKEGIDWDATLNIGLSLWSWGANNGAVLVSQSVLRQRHEELNGLVRQANLEIENAYRDFAASREQLTLRQTAVDLARKDYALQIEDDRRGLVTSLEVLVSLNQLNSAELAYSSARLAVRLAALNLEIAAGANPEEILQ